ncbi:SMP-30/gluconolactonase/LRE family protein [Arthrobacter sp. TWP1-1]|uniref:SMP-30/gluconolactonase/LRE family protein n=1 Tax=Arthrobacter sp. TWP1-1 TaxID=2804568 RepID=UPI003CEB343F
MPRIFTATPASELRAELGETPRLDPRTGEVIWTDITAGKVHFGAVREDRIEWLRSFDVGGMSGPVTPLPDAGAGWIMAREQELVHVAQDGSLESLATPEAGRNTGFNDGAADHRGNLWVGSMGRDGLLGAGRLWRIDLRGNATMAMDGIGISNGLDFTSDGGTAYYVDTVTRTLERLELSPDGTIAARHCLVEFLPGEGDPDGLAMDDEGCIWVAMWDGWAVRRYSPGGELLAVVQVPVARPTAVCFVDELLLITTCGAWLPEGWEQEQPDAGRMFSARVGVSGAPARPYRGQLQITVPPEDIS